MEKIRGSKIILNGTEADTSAYQPDVSASIYYEVIRVVKGKFIFLKDHLSRLMKSCEAATLSPPEESVLIHQIRQLTELLQISDGNIKLAVYPAAGKLNTACFFVPHSYPSEEDYIKGVQTKTYGFTRPDPGIKKWNEQFRLSVNRFIQEEKIYEALLVNRDNELTEGSRSNLFFIDPEDRLVTAPVESILPGITRKYVMQIAEEKAIPVLEKCVRLDEINSMKFSFITGTSPKVLPLSKIDDKKFETDGSLMRMLIDEYERMIFAQIQE